MIPVEVDLFNVPFFSIISIITIIIESVAFSSIVVEVDTTYIQTVCISINLTCLVCIFFFIITIIIDFDAFGNSIIEFDTTDILCINLTWLLFLDIILENN